MGTIPVVPARARGLNRFQWEAVGDIRLELAGHVYFPPGEEGRLHSHPFWELILIGSGKGTVRFGNAFATCAANDVHIVRPGEKHQYAADPLLSMEQLYFGFSCDFAPLKAWKVAPPRSLPAGPAGALIHGELRELRVRLREHGRRPIHDALRARILLVVSRVIEVLMSAAPEERQAVAERKAPPVHAAMDYIAANFREKLSVLDLARRCCLSPKYFGHIFKESTGLSVKEYQLRMRLLRARELMQEGAFSVTTIAREVGFENLPYFSRLFKREFRVPPSRMR